MITLRSYQTEALEALIAAQERGQRRVVLSLATGGGKTSSLPGWWRWQPDTAGC